jgi:hypothetical protein
VYAAEARARIRCDVLEADRLYDVDHEIAARSVSGQYVDRAYRIDVAWRDWCAGLSGWRGWLRLSSCCIVCDERSSAGHCCALEKSTTIDGTPGRHRSLHVTLD